MNHVEVTKKKRTKALLGVSDSIATELDLRLSALKDDEQIALVNDLRSFVQHYTNVPLGHTSPAPRQWCRNSAARFKSK
jgi:hypothetical protein